MRPHEKDILLASADQVAIDAISAKMQGFKPMDLPFIRIAHEKGLGVGEPKDIEIVGYDVSLEDWKFVKEDTFASKGQHLIYHGPLKRFEKQLLQSPLAGWSYFASNFYHNVYWYPVVGRKRVKDALQTKWGRLFESYGDGRVVLPGTGAEADRDRRRRCGGTAGGHDSGGAGRLAARRRGDKGEAVEGGLAGIHEILGGLVVVAFIVMAILAAIAAAGRDIPWIRQASFVAAGLLLLQYLLGVLLLANGYRNTRSHIAIALLVLFRSRCSIHR